MESEVVAALVAGLVALITGTLSALVTLAVARHRGSIDKELQTQLKIAEGRLPAYNALWRCMMPVSLTASVPLTDRVRSALDGALRKAFYEEGGGLLLSHAVLSHYVKAVGALNDQQCSDADVRKAFAALRTQMKKDLSVYTEHEARISVRNGRLSAY